MIQEVATVRILVVVKAIGALIEQLLEISHKSNIEESEKSEAIQAAEHYQAKLSNLITNIDHDLAE